MYHLWVEGGRFLGRHSLRRQVAQPRGKCLVSASLLLEKNQKIALTVNKVLRGQVSGGAQQFIYS